MDSNQQITIDKIKDRLDAINSDIKLVERCDRIFVPIWRRDKDRELWFNCQYEFNDENEVELWIHTEITADIQLIVEAMTAPNLGAPLRVLMTIQTTRIEI